MNIDTALSDGSYPLKVGVTTFNASMLTDRDYSDLSNYIRAKFIAMAYDAAALLKPDQRRELISIAMKEAVYHNWTTDEGQEIIWDEEGLQHVGHQMIRKRHPGVTLDQFVAACRVGTTEEEINKNRREAMTEISKVFNIINFPTQEQKDEAGDLGGSSTGSSKSD